MFTLKPISAGGIPGALAKAERYRLLNDPSAAESICLDILAVDPEHQGALVGLALARSDQFAGGHGGGLLARAREVLPRIRDPYRRAYYAGVVAERHAKAALAAGGPGSPPIAYEGFRQAMEHYEAAERLRPDGNDEAVLRWNTCARILNDHPTLAPRGEERYEPALEE